MAFPRTARQRLLKFEFLWFHRVRLLLERKDIVALATQCRRAGGRAGHWEYRVALIGANGHRVGLTDWEEDAELCNDEAAKLATMLGCKADTAAPDSEMVVRGPE